MQPFEQITVLDLTHVLAGPFATYQLAVLGANVIKVEPPRRLDMARGDGADEGDVLSAMGSEFQAQAANKRSLLLDLSMPKGQAVLKRLAKSVDVLVENYTAGTLDRLGLGAAELTALNPRLIYCSMTGFGQNGAKRRHPAYDNVIQAFSGLMHATGTPESGPVKVGPPVLDYATGAQAAFAIASALFLREKTGKGQCIDVAMLDAALVAMSATVMSVLATGKPPLRTGNSCALPGYAAYEANDGLLMIGAYSAAQHKRLYRALGLHELADEVSNDATVLDMVRRTRDVQQIASIIGRQSAGAWENILNEARIPAARVRSIDEALASLDGLGRRVIQSPEGCSSDARLFPVAAFHFANGGPRVRTLPPRPGEHSDAVLAEFAFSREEIAELRTGGIVA